MAKKASDYKRKPVPRSSKPGPSFGAVWMMPPELMPNTPASAPTPPAS